MWSSETLARTADQAPLGINPLVYGEVSVGFQDIETPETALPPEFRREAIPWDAAFLAGKSFLIQDPRRYRAYLPTVALIAPT